MNPILEVKNLSVVFDGKAAVERVSFALEKGDSLAILGPNGSGKTVLLRALMGIVPYEGAVVWAPDTTIGYVPQKVDADRHLPLTFHNLLSAKARVCGARDSIVRCADEVGLPREALSAPVGHLSGGQFQRGLIAFALIGDPRVLLLDEPTASIDTPGEEQIYELIHRLQDSRGVSVIVVSHDLSFVYRRATKVLCLNRTGVCFGTPEEALHPDTLEKLYGGPRKYFHHLHEHEHS